jgi:hypothetical protein
METTVSAQRADRVTSSVKYWLYLGAKLAVAGALSYGLQRGVQHSFPVPPPNRYSLHPPMFLQDMGFTFAIFAVWLVGAALFTVALVDQRRRCRVCLRRLRMPVATGSWGNMLTFGRPQTSWICPYGHGTLTLDDLQITGLDPGDWEPHGDDIWKELESTNSRER